MAMGACPGQIPLPCVPPALMVTASLHGEHILWRPQRDRFEVLPLMVLK